MEDRFIEKRLKRLLRKLSDYMKAEKFDTNAEITWCPGCGNYGILTAMKQAIVKCNIDKKDLTLVSGIGCSSYLPHFIHSHAIHTIHGRALPIATGLHLANHKLKVIVNGGDGDGYGIGGNHFIHACRRNLDITYIVHNNQIYGLTKGQYSPTTDKGMATVTTPDGAIEPAVNPIALAIAMDATFVARGFAQKLDQLTDIMCQAIKHKGIAVVDVLQPCVTFNKKNTYQWYLERVFDIPEGHDVTDKDAAFSLAMEWGNKIPLGVFYNVKRKTYVDEISYVNRNKSLLEQMPKKKVDVKKLVDDLT